MHGITIWQMFLKQDRLLDRVRVCPHGQTNTLVQALSGSFASHDPMETSITPSAVPSQEYCLLKNLWRVEITLKKSRKISLSLRVLQLDNCFVSVRVFSKWPRSSFLTVASVS